MKLLVRPASLLFFSAAFLSASHSMAWGRRGHSTVAVTAAYVISANPDNSFLKYNSYDLGYYANVPDFFWKEPATYAAESVQHFFDVEVFQRALKTENQPLKDDLFNSNRTEFFSQHSDIPAKAGRAPWRIQEFSDRLREVSEKLRKSKPGDEGHKDLQGQWLVIAGTMAHYVGDLAQPVHCSENYDGELTGQKGIHGFFENIIIDELYPEIEKPILSDALKAWPKFHKKYADRTAFQLALDLCRDSNAKVKSLLAIDKKVGRKDLLKAKVAYRDLAKERLVIGSLYLAEIYTRNMGWKYDDKKFYYFKGEPAWVAPLPETR